MQLQWVEADGGYRVGSYRIERLHGHPRHNWRIVVAEDSTVGAILPTPSTYRSLRATRTEAVHLEWLRLRRIRIRRLASVGIPALVVSVVALPFTTSFPSFALAVLGMFVGLRSLSAALELRFSSAWQVPEDQHLERVTSLDRAMSAMVESLRRPEDDEEEQAVRVLPPVPVE